MAVYTQLTKDDVESFLLRYDCGKLSSFKGIAEGISNTNFQIVTTDKKYILTLYEKRIDPDDLPFFMGLTQWLAERGIHCPRPIKTKNGETVTELKGKPAALIEFLEGHGNPHIIPAHLSLLGGAVARMQQAAKDFSLSRPNSLSIAGWRQLFGAFANHADDIAPHLQIAVTRELDFLEENWPRHLPAGVIHGDIFPDNVFFIDGHTSQPELTGIIDFYFACNDFWMYDLAIVMNAWCFDSAHRFVPERAQALWQSYNKVRQVTEAEKEALPILARGAAMRFLMTRSFDWLNRSPGALVNLKDPMEYLTKLHFHQKIGESVEYGLE